jgi:hypothetical protein
MTPETVISQLPVDLRRRTFGYVRHPLAMLFVSTPREPLYHVRAEPTSHYIRCHRYDAGVEAADAQMEIELQAQLASLPARSDEWLAELRVMLRAELAIASDGPEGSYLHFRLYAFLVKLQGERAAQEQADLEAHEDAAERFYANQEAENERQAYSVWLQDMTDDSDED